jgi:hypothetical protein
MRSRVFVGTALLSLGVLSPTPRAEADPIIVTSGTIVQPGGPGANPGSGNVAGTENFTWIGQIDIFASFGTQCELRCSPGAIIDLNAVLRGTAAKGEVTYQDQQFLVGGSPASFGSVNMDFITPTLTLPPPGSAATFSLPFTMSGSLGFPFFGPPAQPNVPLSGSGFVIAIFGPSPPSPNVAPGWQLRQITYEFSDPVPEPATMFLVGSGVLALLRRRMRSGKTA